MPTLFSRIIAHELPAEIIAEEEDHIAFLDVRPLTVGHTLVVPRREEASLFDLSDEALGKLMAFAKQVAAQLAEVVPCVRVATLTLGLEVPHVHLHLLPILQESDLHLQGTRKVPATPDALARLGDRLRAVTA